jgi:aryl-alcohol dehydrogenase-like predicted oxidoreductase
VLALAEQAGTSSAALALRWLLQRPGPDPVIVPVVGARTTDQIQRTIIDATTPLPQEVLMPLDDVAPPEPGFPHDLIASHYLRKLALGDPALVDLPKRGRA